MAMVHLADRWEENQEFLKQKLGVCDSTQFGARWVLMPVVPYPRFNHVSRIRIAPDQVDQLLEAARDFFRREAMPAYSLMITPATQPSDLGVRLFRMGFRAETNPVMIWNGRVPAAADPPGLLVRRVEPGEADLFWDILYRVFYAYANLPVIEAGREGVQVASQHGGIHYLATLWGRPAGVGTLFCHGGMGGIYNMGTLPEFQRRGVATAVMRRALADAQAMGCQHVGLTPTFEGRRLYEGLGFREIYQEIYFSHPTTGAGI